MSKGFSEIIEFTLKWEGGYSNNPKDPGGETNFGISKRSYPNVDIKNLTKEQAETIYYNDYWRASGAKDMDWPLSAVVFDTAVNMGLHRVKRLLEKSGNDAFALLKARNLHYLKIIAKKPLMKVFEKGWMNRANALEEFIKQA